jgi:nucleoside-diphosphate-sugar epimerase
VEKSDIFRLTSSNKFTQPSVGRKGIDRMDERQNPRPARVLVTGASGTIGSATTEYLVANGIAVTAFSLAGPFPPGADRVFEGDATSPEDVARAFEDVDAVVHLAAIPHPNLGTAHKVFSTNVVSTFTVLAQAGELKIPRAVIASSINAIGYPFNRHRPMPPYFPLDETIAPDAEDAYSLSKIVDEATARMAARRWGIDVVALRFPYVGEGNRLLERARHVGNRPADYVAEGWAYLDLRDATRAILLSLLAPVSGCEVIGLSARDTFLDVPTADALAKFAPGVPQRAEIVGRAAAIDTSRAESILGFVPAHSIHEILTETRE